jgi:folate-binding protein YgfZ
MLNYRYHRGQFAAPLATFLLSGSDTDRFLMSQSTFDTAGLSAGDFHLISFLDPQGRLECYGWLAKDSGQALLLVPPALATLTQERLERFLISEDVEVKAQGTRDWFFILGPRAAQVARGYRGELFAEPAYLSPDQAQDTATLAPEEIELARGLSGWPDFSGEVFKKELINNLRLFDLTVSMNKGCYPGQETVSKIATRRGAAFYPVLLEVAGPMPAGALLVASKKIGEVSACYAWDGRHYLAAQLIRDFRVEGMRINATLADREVVATVRYYPLLSGEAQDKARELFYAASDLFRQDRLDEAKESLKLAIEVCPDFADAYESLGVILGREERFQEALEYMRQLSEVDPSSVLAHTNMSLYLMRLGRIEEAEEEKSQATLKSFQKFGEEARHQQQLEAQKQKQAQEWEQRESMFRQVLEIDPDDTLANYGLGAIAVEKSDWDPARLHLEKVLQVDPNYSVAYLALGRAYQGLGLRAEARATFQRGIVVAASKGDLMPANQMQLELDQLL